MFNFIIIHRTVVRYDFFQQCSKLWNVPLAGTQVVKMLASGIIGIGCELDIEGSTRCDDPQVFVENDERFTNGVHHCLGKGTSVFDLAELLFEHKRPFPGSARHRDSEA